MFFLFGRKKKKRSIIPTKIKKECKKLKIKLTKKTSSGKRVYKSIKQLKKEIKSKRTKSRFGFPTNRGKQQMTDTYGRMSVYYPDGWYARDGYHITQGSGLRGGAHATGPSGCHYNGSNWWPQNYCKWIDDEEADDMMAIWDDYVAETWYGSNRY